MYAIERWGTAIGIIAAFRKDSSQPRRGTYVCGGAWTRLGNVRAGGQQTI